MRILLGGKLVLGWKQYIRSLSYVTMQDTSELFFEDVRLPKSALLGEVNKGFYYLMQELPQERLLIASLGLSACEWMFEETRNYIRQRKAFGKTLSKLQVKLDIFLVLHWIYFKYHSIQDNVPCVSRVLIITYILHTAVGFPITRILSSMFLFSRAIYDDAL